MRPRYLRTSPNDMLFVIGIAVSAIAATFYTVHTMREPAPLPQLSVPGMLASKDCVWGRDIISRTIYDPDGAALATLTYSLSRTVEVEYYGRARTTRRYIDERHALEAMAKYVTGICH